MFPFGGDLLAIYLQDHLAGATTGLELCRRARDENRGSDLGDLLAELAEELQEDRDELREIMRELGVADDVLKVVAAWTGEKLGRLKLNGRLTSYSPLSRVLELEGLVMGVNGKLSLWYALRRMADADARFDAARYDRLIARGESQVARLREHHEAVAPAAFGVSAPAPARAR
jgi:hypothetical protein